MGSANEAGYQLLLSKDLGYILTENYNKMCIEIEGIQKMLAGYIRKISNSCQPSKS